MYPCSQKIVDVCSYTAREGGQPSTFMRCFREAKKTFCKHHICNIHQQWLFLVALSETCLGVGSWQGRVAGWMAGWVGPHGWVRSIPPPPAWGAHPARLWAAGKGEKLCTHVSFPRESGMHVRNQGNEQVPFQCHQMVRKCERMLTTDFHSLADWYIWGHSTRYWHH